MRQLFRTNKLQVFKPLLRFAHWPVNYKLWFQVDYFYDVKFLPAFEPYVIAHKDLVPWFDPRFQ